MNISLVPFRETPYELQFLFVDKMFKWQQKVLLPDLNPVDFLITSPGDQMIHFIRREIIVNSGASDSLVGFYSGPNATLNTASDIFNVNRGSTNVATLSIGTSNTIAPGTLIESIFLGFGRTVRQKSEELILKKNTEYLLRFITTSPPVEINVIYVWYESGN